MFFVVLQEENRSRIGGVARRMRENEEKFPPTVRMAQICTKICASTDAIVGTNNRSENSLASRWSMESAGNQEGGWQWYGFPPWTVAAQEKNRTGWAS